MKLVVVGGVAAGASVAARARRLDEFAEIIVFERSGNVSGTLYPQGYFRSWLGRDRLT